MGRRSSGWMERLGKRFSRKAVTGKALTIVISLITALMALVLLWAFLTRQMPLITGSIENIIIGLKGAVCDKFGMLKVICKTAIS